LMVWWAEPTLSMGPPHGPDGYGRSL